METNGKKQQASIHQRDQLKWWGPAKIECWVDVFGMGQKTLLNCFKNKTIKNKKISRNSWLVATEDMPGELITHIFLQEQLEGKQTFTKGEEATILQHLKWSQPKGIKQWALIFGKVHRNTMSSWLKDGVIRNEQLSPRFWRISIEDLPPRMVINVLLRKLQVESIREKQQVHPGIPSLLGKQLKPFLTTVKAHKSTME